MEVQELQKELQTLKKLNLMLVQKQYENEEKKEEIDTSNIKQNILKLKDAINQFLNAYNVQTINEIYSKSPDSLNIDNELESLKSSASNLVEKVSDAQLYIKSLMHPDPLKYKEWNVNMIIQWISSLENGRFRDYINTLRNGFESDSINGELLPTLSTIDLRAAPFVIKDFATRADLIKHFQSLKHHQDDDHYDVIEAEGIETAHL